MNRRNLLKTFLAAPAIIRSGVLMPVVPLVAAPAVAAPDRWSVDELRAWIDMGQREIVFKADRLWVQDGRGRRLYDTGPVGLLEQRAVANAQDFFNRMYVERLTAAMAGRA